MSGHEELIAQARRRFAYGSGWDSEVPPGSMMDVLRRLADALEVADSELDEALKQVQYRQNIIDILAPQYRDSTRSWREVRAQRNALAAAIKALGHS